MNIIQVNTADIKLNGNVRGKTITDEEQDYNESED